MDTVAKKPGRPSKYSVPMTTAQRVRETRERAFQSMLQANEDLPNASLKAIIGNLERQISMIETNPEYRQTGRAIAADLMLELCKRYKIVIG